MFSKIDFSSHGGHSDVADERIDHKMNLHILTPITLMLARKVTMVDEVLWMSFIQREKGKPSSRTRSTLPPIVCTLIIRVVAIVSNAQELRVCGC